MKIGLRKKIVITGSSGSIGTILCSGLEKDFDILRIDRIAKDSPTVLLDLTKEHERLKSYLRSQDVIIHLAWNMNEDFPNETIVAENKTMAENIYREAIAMGVPRVIIASSVHAADYSHCHPGDDLEPTCNHGPDSPYGASKIYIEALGRYFASAYNLEVICIRFGGVNASDEIRYREDPFYDRVLLYQEDCLNLLRRCVLTKRVPKKFEVLNAVSDNKKRVHSIDNFLQWKPGGLKK